MSTISLSYSEGLRPSDSPTRSLARRCAGALRSRGSLATLARGCGASPLGLAYTLSRAPLRRRAPFAWLARDARSRLWGFAPRTRLHALSRAAAPARSVRVARSRRSLAAVGLRPSDSPARSLARRCAGALRSRGSLARSLAARFTGSRSHLALEFVFGLPPRA